MRRFMQTEILNAYSQNIKYVTEMGRWPGCEDIFDNLLVTQRHWSPCSLYSV